MKCLKCGKENPNNAKRCSDCNTPMAWTPNSEYEPPVTVKVSRLAIIAISLALCSLILGVVGIIIIRILRLVGPRSPIVSPVFFLSFMSVIVAFILGFISLIRIEISGGKITGRSFAIGAIILSLFLGVIPIWDAVFIRTRSVAFHMVCGTNLSGIGKAMLIYANDYDDELPRAGGRNSIWGTNVKWDAPTRYAAYGLQSNGSGGSATISSSLYLLVKYAEVTPKSFLCKGDLGDKGVSEFEAPRNIDLVQLWDFGSEPWKHNSYSYHMPYGQYSLTTSSEPGMAVAADRNPFMPSSGWDVKDIAKFNPDGDKEARKAGNSFTHQNDGQNVLYLDSHVDFDNVSFCGINQDNIYTSQDGGDIRKGTPPKLGSQPANRSDSLLVNDPPVPKSR